MANHIPCKKNRQSCILLLQKIWYNLVGLVILKKRIKDTECSHTFYVSFALEREVHMERIEKLNSEDEITIELFGKEERVQVFSTGDNQFDENGHYKDAGFSLTDDEIACLNWFLEHIKIEDYTKEITEYCNEQYDMIGEDDIEQADVENEISIFGIAINISQITQAGDGFLYPEISFVGECECDPEHGICIGFRDKKFLGIHAQDWTL